MKNSKSDAYAASGVDITAGYKAVQLMKEHVSRTNTSGVMSDVGGFGGLFAPDMKGVAEPVLVSGTDGVGTKLKLAFTLDKHDTIGIDCVAMCVNDIICCGARPLFFLDYIACGKNVPERIAEIVKGVADGCVQSGAALIGGETAEMPGFYEETEYDLAGFAVGMVDKQKMLDKRNVSEGDIIIALPSSGVHSNGFSLVRKVFDVETADRDLVAQLLTPTKIYVKPILALMDALEVKTVAHITGGGFYENIPRALPDGCTAKIKKDDVRILPIFERIAAEGGISERDMFNTFNMGVGMICVVKADDKEKALEILHANGEDAYVLGEIVNGDEGVILW
ncbi:MAG: phosphoribosylformylglycinamidine cyclo-ligase [Bacillota bacterium]|nr:phosphoribosylformylglycinamidine cyclo-ligase [Bacillota bacterium]